MIAIEQIVTRAKMRLGVGETSKNDVELRLYVNEGAKDSLATDVKVLMCKEVAVDCHKAECNKDFLFFTTPTSTCTCDTSPCLGSCKPFYYFKTSTELQYAISSGMGCARADSFTYSGGYLNLPTNIDTETVVIWYMGYNTDSDGFMLLDDDWEEALSLKAALEFSKVATRFRMYEGFRQTVNMDWLAKFNKLAGQKFIREFNQNKNLIYNVMKKSFLYYAIPQGGGFGGRQE